MSGEITKVSTFIETIAAVKAASPAMANLAETVRNRALSKIADSLEAEAQQIFSANEMDLQGAKAAGEPAPIVNRLVFDAHKLSDVVSGIRDLINLPDSLFRTLLRRRLDRGLTLYKESCPIGVIGVIFESRPDALVQIACLCVKSGNSSILKGGKEAAATNKVLFEIIRRAGMAAGLPETFATLVENRSDIGQLLTCHGLVDLIIPRGSNEFVQYIMANSKIPVMGHADGICHIYAAEDCDVEKALPIILDGKTQYVSACNTVETLLVHREAAPELLPPLKTLLDKYSVLIKGCEETRKYMDVAPATEADFATEYLDYILSVKIVSDDEAAISHINKYGSHHTDAILTESADRAAKFMSLVDSAGVYHNCSTRFADGYRYGFGAEVGISTGKLHARGPVGLEGLVTYKYKLFGHGDLVSDYASGAKKFNFKDF